MICDRCFKPREVGAHGLNMCPFEPRRASVRVQSDTIIGGFLAENAWRTPRYFDSQKAYEKALAADGMELRPRYDLGRRLTTTTIDSQTLENARVLVSRQARIGTWTERVLPETVCIKAEA